MGRIVTTSFALMVGIALIIGIGTLPASARGIDEVAHRGYGHSTAAEYQRAGSARSILESDLQLTRENVVVIAHDARLRGRCAGMRISSMTWPDVHACDPKIITLDALLRTATRYGVRAWVEFKDNGGKKWTNTHLRTVYRRIAAHGMLRRTEVYSFVPSLVAKWRKIDRKRYTKTGININTIARLTTGTIRKYGERAAVKLELLTPRKVASLRDAGLYISVYTVDTPAEMNRARALRPNAIVSNIPF